MKNIFIILAALSFGCRVEQSSEDSLDSVHVYYFKGYFESPASGECKSIVVNNEEYTSVADTVITDRKVLRAIDSCLKAMNTPLNNKRIDARLRCVLNYSNSKTETLCLGEKIGISFRGEVYKNNLLIYLIKRHSGYYNYFPVNHLKYFKELKDTLRRNTIINEMPKLLYFRNNSNKEIIDIVVAPK